jgi:N-methylhydantoinase A
MTFRRRAEMRYVGQGHEVEVEVPAAALGPESVGALTASFETAYRALYSRTPLGVAIEALNWRVVVSGPSPDISIETVAPDAGMAGTAVIKKRRPAYFPEAGGYLDTPVYDRYRLKAGERFEGPAIIEERESTTVIGPGARIHVDARHTLIAELVP